MTVYVLTVEFDDEDETGYGIDYLEEAIEQGGGYITSKAPKDMVE